MAGKFFGIEKLADEAPVASGPVYITGNIIIDFGRQRVVRGGVDVKVTSTEMDILEVLVENAGHIVTHESLQEEVWGGRKFSATYRSHMANTQRKLGRGVIATHSGKGYSIRQGTLYKKDNIFEG